MDNIYAAARSELVKAHNDEYRALVRQIAEKRGVKIRPRRTASEVAAAREQREADLVLRRFIREGEKAAKLRARQEAKIATAKARLAALEAGE